MLNKSLNASLRFRDLNNASKDFDFLMQSMERDKQNLNNNLTSSSTTIDFGASKRDIKKFVLGDDVGSQPRASLGSSMIQSFDMEQLIKKTEAYLVVTEKLMDIEKTNGSLKSQLVRIGEEVQAQIEAYRKENTQAPFFNNISLRKSFNMKGFQSMSRREDGNLIKKMKELETENERLSSLVARHEDTNIKMYIKINEEQSSDIQQYKALLQSSYNDYKQLQAKVREYQSRIRQLEKEKIIIDKDSANKTRVIEYLEQKLAKAGKDEKSQQNQNRLQAVIDKQNKELEALYSNMKQILAKHEEKERVWTQEIQKLKKKLKEKSQKSVDLKKKQSQSMKPPDKRQQPPRPNDLGHQIFSYLVLQASTIQEFLTK